jgi:hypothetical protein
MGDVDTIMVTFAANSAFVNAIINSLANQKFILGITNQSMNYGDLYTILNSSVALKIYFRPPQQTVIVDQRLANDSSYGVVSHFENSTFVPYMAPHTFSFPATTRQYFQADTSSVLHLGTYQKHSKWNDDNTDILNYDSILISPTTYIFKAQFDKTVNATIENVFRILLQVLFSLLIHGSGIQMIQKDYEIVE